MRGYRMRLPNTPYPLRYGAPPTEYKSIQSGRCTVPQPGIMDPLMSARVDSDASL